MHKSTRNVMLIEISLEDLQKVVESATALWHVTVRILSVAVNMGDLKQQKTVKPVLSDKREQYLSDNLVD